MLSLFLNFFFFFFGVSVCVNVFNSNCSCQMIRFAWFRYSIFRLIVFVYLFCSCSLYVWVVFVYFSYAIIVCFTFVLYTNRFDFLFSRSISLDLLFWNSQSVFRHFLLNVSVNVLHLLRVYSLIFLHLFICLLLFRIFGGQPICVRTLNKHCLATWNVFSSFVYTHFAIERSRSFFFSRSN